MRKREEHFGNLIAVLLITVIFLIVYSWCQKLTFFVMPTEYHKRNKTSSSKRAPKLVVSAAAQRLPRNGSVFCWVSTSPKYHHSRVLAVNETWLPRCDHGEFFSTKPINDETIPYSTVFSQLDDSCDQLFHKTREAFHHVYKLYSMEFDWYFKADDDTYVIWENLEKYLKTLDPTIPHFLGHTLKPFLKDGYQSGGAGYLLSKAALKLFIDKAYGNQTICPFDIYEDVGMSRCLANIGIAPKDTRNANKQHRFNPANITSMFNIEKDDIYAKWPWNRGYEGFASELITLHHVAPNQMREYDIIRYRTIVDPKNH